MALKQINWGYQFQRNSKGPLDPNSTFKTYDAMVSSVLVYNGAIVSVTNDVNESRNGMYLVTGSDDTGLYVFSKAGTSNSDFKLPIIVSNKAIVIDAVWLEEDSTYKITLSENPFENLDIIGWSQSDDLSEGEYSVVKYSLGDSIYIDQSNKIPGIGETIYHIGNLVLPARLAFGAIFLRDRLPIYGVFSNNNLERLNTDIHTGIKVDSAGNPQLYSENALLKGTFIDLLNRNLSELIDKTNRTLSTSVQDLRDEFSSKNLISNPFFLEDMKGWTTHNEAIFFRIGNKWIYNQNFAKTQDGLYSAKRKGAYVSSYDEKLCLSLLEGSVELKAEDLRSILSNSEVEFPVYVSVSFVYKVVSPGTLTVSLGRALSEYTLDQPSDWVQVKTILPWNGEDGLRLEFTSGTEIHSEIKIRGIIFEIDDTETLKRKYEDLFAHSTALIAMALEYEAEHPEN